MDQQTLNTLIACTAFTMGVFIGMMASFGIAYLYFKSKNK